MSGGCLKVLDRLGRDVKTFDLKEGLATLGSDSVCDIIFKTPTVSPHHATVAVHTNQTVVHSASVEPTLVNGMSVSVAALRHGDEISIGGHRLRWEYSDATASRPNAPQPALTRRAHRPGRPQRASGPLRPCSLTLPHRASVPAERKRAPWKTRDTASSSTSGIQVAIVQPLRRDTGDQNETIGKTSGKLSKRSRGPRLDDLEATEDQDQPSRKWSGSVGGESTTKASLWCDSRRAVPRRTPHKIHDPPHIDHTKQAAIMLMTGHTPKGRSPKARASLLVKRSSTVRKTPRRSNGSPKITPSRPGRRSAGTHSISLLEIGSGSRRFDLSSCSQPKSPLSSPVLGNPKKSALKDPTMKKHTRKTESIKFDLSNLDGDHDLSSDVLLLNDATKELTDSSSDVALNFSESSTAMSPSPRKSSRSTKILETSSGTPVSYSATEKSTLTIYESPRSKSSLRARMISNLDGDHDRSSNVLLLNDSTKELTNDSSSNMTLHFSELSTPMSPSARKSSRSTKILEKSLGTPVSYATTEKSKLSLCESPRSKSSLRGSMILKKAIENSRLESRLSRSIKNISEQSFATVQSDRKSRSPRTTGMESYSIINLISVESHDSNSIYGSAGSTDSSLIFDTPHGADRRTRSGKLSLPSSSTPYNKHTVKSNKSDTSKKSHRISDSLTTPENIQSGMSLNSTKISRVSKSRSRINDSDLLLLEEDDDASPRSSRRGATSKATPRKNISIVEEAESPVNSDGTTTPQNEQSPKQVGTPVLSIKSLLDESQNHISSNNTHNFNRRSKARSETRSVKRLRTSIKSKSFTVARERAKRTYNKSQGDSQDEEIVVTPKSAVKLVHEAVKNKHSTAKKPQSKRSIIDTLNNSDIVKHLFNSPVKRNLSQSMTEILHWQVEDDAGQVRPTRHTVALTGRTPDNSILEAINSITPDVFVSPLNTPSDTPVLSGVRQLYRNKTPKNDSRNIRGVKTTLRTPRVRKSIKNDLTNVSGVKKVFARSPQNRLSDVRVKKIFASSPKNDLRQVYGVKSLFKPTNSNETATPDLRGVRSLFKRSPRNDYSNISGVKALQRNSPKNDLRNVAGVKELFRENRQQGLSDVSGVEELFEEHQEEEQAHNLDATFDDLIGKPRLKSYGKSKSMVIGSYKSKKRATKSLHDSINSINSNVEEWLQMELHRSVKKANIQKSMNKSIFKSNSASELQKLTINTVEGNVPIRLSRSRSGTMVRSTRESSSFKQSTLPIKKRSITDTSSNKISHVNKALNLPIKKRALMHSTPVKGRVDITLNTTEMGRMSPIASVEVAPHIVPLGDPATEKTPTKRKEKQNSSIIEAKDKNKRKSQPKATTPIQPRTRRGKKASESYKAVKPVVIRKMKSISITKKTPVPSSGTSTQTPQKRLLRKHTRTTLKIETKNQSISLPISKPTRQSKAKIGDQKVTENKTYEKEIDITMVTNKHLKTKTRNKNTEIKINTNTDEIPARVTRNRKNENHVHFSEDQIKPKRIRKTQEVSSKGKGKIAAETASKEIPKLIRRTRVTKTSEISNKKVNTKENVIDAIPKITTRLRKGKSTNIKEATENNNNTEEGSVEPVSKRGRKNVSSANQVEVIVRRGRNAKVTQNINEKERTSQDVETVEEPVESRRGKRVVRQENILEKVQSSDKTNVRLTRQRNAANGLATNPNKGKTAAAQAELVNISRSRPKRKAAEDTKAVLQTIKRRKLSVAEPTPKVELRSSGRGRRR